MAPPAPPLAAASPRDVYISPLTLVGYLESPAPILELGNKRKCRVSSLGGSKSFSGLNVNLSTLVDKDTVIPLRLLSGYQAI
jgi:hypothetical protein